MKTNRIVTITSFDSAPISNSLEFNSKEMRDSEALHQLLCFNDPGDNYTVEFKDLCTHLNVLEIGMVGQYPNTHDCGKGCKVVKCEKCGDIFESHNASYGCAYQAI